MRAIIAVSDADEYAADIVKALRTAGLRADSDLRNEKISYKVREHSVAKIPVLFAIGQREIENRTVAVRRLGSKKQEIMSLEDAVASLKAEVDNRGQGD